MPTNLYIALVDGEPGAYGVVFPDLPGCLAGGATVEEAVADAAKVMPEWAGAVEAGGGEVALPRSFEDLKVDPEFGPCLADPGVATVMVPMIRPLQRSVKANLSIDAGVLSAIDAAAERRGVTRSAMVEILAKETLPFMV
jgi:predicted RNase H-like HicB family nuclease